MEWMSEWQSNLMNEFTDVSESEKKFMLIWNTYCMKHETKIFDSNFLKYCERFIEENANKLFELNLVSNFWLHLKNLLDYGLLKNKCLIQLVDRLNSMRIK